MHDSELQESDVPHFVRYQYDPELREDIKNAREALDVLRFVRYQYPSAFFAPGCQATADRALRVIVGLENLIVRAERGF